MSGVPIRTWARALDDATRRQLQHLAQQPYVVSHVAAMPDAHVASGVAVGTVFATEHTLVPGALGGDLGCGMSARRITDHAVERPLLERFVHDLGRAIPVGQAPIPVPSALLETALSTGSLDHTRESLSGRHLGTLGGGNHFVELDRDGQGRLWLLVHSGSRGLGAAIAAHHGRAAGGPLAGLDVRAEGAAYLTDLDWALAFARANRDALAARALQVFASATGLDPSEHGALDVHHNFVTHEHWLDRDLWVHRKGAVAAPHGAEVLIPGSMGTASYVAVGLGCAAAFGSCSHGAGRVLSRSQARAQISSRSLARERSARRGLPASSRTLARGGVAARLP